MSAALMSLRIGPSYPACIARLALAIIAAMVSASCSLGLN
jgi:hypothetical protein